MRTWWGILAPFLLLPLGCEIERVDRSSPATESSGELPPAPPAKTSLSEALSKTKAEKSPRSTSATEPAASRSDEPIPPQTSTPKAPDGPPLSELSSWWSKGPSGFAQGTLFVYGGGPASAQLTLPASTPQDIIDALLAVVDALEAHPDTNAGMGAALRLDGSSEVEAVIRDATGRVGRVVGVHEFASPSVLAGALLRAGGVTLRDRAVERLIAKLQLERATLQTERSEQHYLSDLANSLGQRAEDSNPALLQLLVTPENIRRALALNRAVSASHVRDPVVVAYCLPQQVSFAASHGGSPLSLPGAPSLLEGERVLSAGDARFVFLMAPEDCTWTAQSLQEDRGRPEILARKVEEQCPNARYAIVEANGVTSNIAPGSFEVVAPSADEASIEALPPAVAPSKPVPSNNPVPTKKPTVPGASPAPPPSHHLQPSAPGPAPQRASGPEPNVVPAPTAPRKTREAPTQEGGP